MSFFFEEQSPFFPTSKEIIHIPTFPFSFKTKEMKVGRGGGLPTLLIRIRKIITIKKKVDKYKVELYSTTWFDYTLIYLLKDEVIYLMTV